VSDAIPTTQEHKVSSHPSRGSEDIDGHTHRMLVLWQQIAAHYPRPDLLSPRSSPPTKQHRGPGAERWTGTV